MSSVSVVIPSYNYAHYLPECVQSALSQATPELEVEVLVIDDCSGDATPVVGERLAAGDPRVEFRRHQKNRGHLATYDEGLAWAHGDYCVILSADDLLVSGALARAARVLDAHPTVGFAYGRSLRFDNDASGLRPAPVSRGADLEGARLDRPAVPDHDELHLVARGRGAHLAAAPPGRLSHRPSALG